MSKFSVRIAEVRKNKNMKQSEVAERLNVTQQRISEYERGTVVPSVERLVELAQILDVSLDELIEFKRIHQSYSEDLSKE